jgi:hypothetical protein
LLGTLYPLLIDALHLGKISVGPPYFNSVFVPIMIPLLVLMGVGPWANWKNTDLVLVIKRLWLAGLVAVVAGISIPLVMGQFTWLAGIGFLLAFWIIASGCLQIIRQAKDEGVLDWGNTTMLGSGEYNVRPGYDQSAAWKIIKRQLKEKGYDGVRFVDDGSTTTALFAWKASRSTIRSLCYTFLAITVTYSTITVSMSGLTEAGHVPSAVHPAGPGQ